MEKSETQEKYDEYYIGIILRGRLKELDDLKEFLRLNTTMSVKYITSSKYYMLIKPAPPKEEGGGKW